MNPKRQLVLDAGALTRTDDEKRRSVIAICKAAVERGVRPLIPSLTLAQAMGADSEQPELAVIEKMSVVVTFEDETAMDVGRLLGRSGTDDVCDAAVVVLAMERGAAVVTATPDAVTALAKAADFQVPVIAV